MRKIVLTYGLIAGGILSAMMLVAVPFRDSIGLDRGMIIGYTSMVMAFLMVYFGMRTYRDNVAGGQLPFLKAVGVGVAISLVATACYVATWEVIYYRIAPGYGEAYATASIEKARKSGASEAELAAKRKEMDEFRVMYDKPLYNIALTSLEPLPVALLFTLVSAGLVSRRKRREATPAIA